MPKNYYNWNEIVIKYSTYQLVDITKNKDLHPDEKIAAAYEELKRRGYENAESNKDAELFKELTKLKNEDNQYLQELISLGVIKQEFMTTLSLSSIYRIAKEFNITIKDYLEEMRFDSATFKRSYSWLPIVLFVVFVIGLYFQQFYVWLIPAIFFLRFLIKFIQRQKCSVLTISKNEIYYGANHYLFSEITKIYLLTIYDDNTQPTCKKLLFFSHQEPLKPIEIELSQFVGLDDDTYTIVVYLNHFYQNYQLSTINYQL